MEKIKILGMSDSPIIATGYANQSREIFKRLGQLNNFECYFQGWQQQGMPVSDFTMNDEKYNITLLENGFKQFGEGKLQAYLDKIQPDILWTLGDLFMLYYMRNIRLNGTKWVCYFPSDGEPLPLGTNDLLQRAYCPVGMSQFAQKQAVDSGIENCQYIPHGINTNKFRILMNNEADKNRLKIKWSEKLSKSNNIHINLIGKKIYLIVGRFQGRKMIGEAFTILSEFFKDKQDVVAIYHGDLEDPAGRSLPVIGEMIKEMHMEGKIVFSGVSLDNSFSDNDMCEMFNLGDLQVSTTSGEGFGITTIESMACGVPSLITDYTTTKELIADTECGEGVKVATKIKGTYNVDRAIVDKKEFVVRLEKLYNNQDLWNTYKNNCRETAVKNYDLDNVVFPMWQKLLEEVAYGK